MPHINRIRVNNVKYNFGTQIYDDFMMRFSAKNTIYDLANGGGKSVLMLLLMQNLIPNCTLDEKQPLEKLFRTNEGSTTIHSLVEWLLSEQNIENGYRYMLTGFCARKAKDSGDEKQKNTAEIEYFNYVIFYRKYNDNDIKNLPLSSDGERITYGGLKNYLKELDRRDYNLEVHIFEKKGDYQRFITKYGLYESHWEIIRGINKTEGHVRTYFETNYKTTRKVVEDLLIEEIIQKSFQNRYNSENEQDSMAKTLLDIKDKLLELSKKKEELHNYDYQMDMLRNFSERVQSIRQIYIGMDELELELSKAYNTVLREEQEKKAERIRIADDRAFAVQEKNNLSRRVETAKVTKRQQELSIYKSELLEYSDKIAKLKEVIHSLTELLKEKECGNDYLEYISYKSEYDKTKEMLEYSLKDNDVLTRELNSLVATWKNYVDNRNQILEEGIAKETEILTKEEEMILSYNGQVGEMTKELAVSEFRLGDIEASKKELLNTTTELRNNSGLLIPAAAKNEIIKLERIIAQKENTKIELEEQHKNYIAKSKDYFYDKQNLIEQGKQIEEQIKWYQGKLDSYDDIAARIESIKNVYGEKELKPLKNVIHKAVHEKVILTNELSDKLKQMKEELNAITSGKSFSESANVKKIIDYIERYHGDKAISGQEFIKTFSEEVRKHLIERIPIIPYSVVILNSFSQIAMDVRITEINTDKYPVALIKKEYIESVLNEDKEFNDDENIFYIASRDTSVYDDEKRKNIIKKLEEDIAELEKKLDRQKETESIMEDDYQVISDGIRKIDEMKEITQKLEDLKLLQKKKELDIESLVKNEAEWEDVLKSISSELMEHEKVLNELNIQKEMYRELYECSEKIDKLDSEAKQLTINYNKLKKECETLESRKEALERQSFARKNKIQKLSEERTSNEIEWKEIYLPYYVEDSSILEGLSHQMLKARLDGAIDTVKKENSDLSDRQKLLTNYGSSMTKALQRIEYKGFDVKQLEVLYNEGELVETTKEELNRIKMEESSANEQLETLYAKEKESTSKCDKCEGIITNAIQVITEKYGYYEEENFGDADINIFISENGELLKEYEGLIKSDEKKLEIIDNEINGYTIVRRDIENRMEISGISKKETDECFNKGIDVEAKSREILKKHERFRNDVSSRREDFIHEKQMLIDTMKNIGGETLAEEIRINVEMPSNYEDTDTLITMFKETVECLELERDMVGRGIEDMEKIKENFESQCLQNCLNIKTELERLPKLSKIVMDGESIPIISLKIPYKKEEEYKEQMSAYIDDIANHADELQSNDERIKYLRNKLSWKRLFSVIVNDMNGIRLNLYKRERIKEQSRYLPYEEAVGSTGQSQGIYIQFLISVINYISSINSKNADASGLRKVVFLDNPFGAAKDVYIWEPIFKLLKTNNVQLIVPARGATPAITGRFDVNYVLGQKMVGKRQQTVVTDYFSNVEKEEIEYTRMEYEQTSLFELM